MAYKWKPSKTARREFAKKMQEDEQFAKEYEERKTAKAVKKRATSKFDYNTAGGNYVPTKAQHDFVFANMHLFTTREEKEAADMVLFGYSTKEKVHHDFIHIINEKMRTKSMGKCHKEMGKIAELYQVVRVGNNSQRRTILSKNITKSEANHIASTTPKTAFSKVKVEKMPKTKAEKKITKVVKKKATKKAKSVNGISDVLKSAKNRVTSEIKKQKDKIVIAEVSKIAKTKNVLPSVKEAATKIVKAIKTDKIVSAAKPSKKKKTAKKLVKKVAKKKLVTKPIKKAVAKKKTAKKATRKVKKTAKK